MAPLATTDLTARILLDTTAVGFAVSEGSTRIRSAMNRGGASVDHGSIVAVVVALVAGVLIAIWSAVDVPAGAIPGRWTPFLAGLVMMWLGIALRQWAVWTLGRFFTVVVRVAVAQTVVETGPYRWVRHPSYTGLLLTLVGLGVALGSWLSVLALATVPSIGLVARIRVEERELLAGLGEPYRKYAEQRRRLVPGIW
jgi:protein-S-isoprenylcysteine O-methyltransferase Ste14